MGPAVLGMRPATTPLPSGHVGGWLVRPSRPPPDREPCGLGYDAGSVGPEVAEYVGPGECSPHELYECLVEHGLGDDVVDGEYDVP